MADRKSPVGHQQDTLARGVAIAKDIVLLPGRAELLIEELGAMLKDQETGGYILQKTDTADYINATEELRAAAVNFRNMVIQISRTLDRI